MIRVVQQRPPDARVLVGIDISKHRHEVLIAAPGKTRRQCMTITNTTEDFVRLIAILRDYGMAVQIGFEATGNYHRVLMYHLGVAGFDLKLVSSVALARTPEALHNSWDKNDSKDAQVILHMLQIGAVQIFQDPMVVSSIAKTGSAWLPPSPSLRRDPKSQAEGPNFIYEVRNLPPKFLNIGGSTERGPSARAHPLEEGAIGFAGFHDGVNGARHLCGDGSIGLAAQIGVVTVLRDGAFELVPEAVCFFRTAVCPASQRVRRRRALP